MFVRSLLVLALLSGAAHADDFERTLNVSNTPDLYVANGSGHIHVFAGSDSQIHVQGHITANWQLFGSAEDRIHRIESNPPIRQAGNEIRIGDVAPEDRSLFNNITIDYEISVPRATALNLHSGSGDIRIDNAGRFLNAFTGSGSIHIRGLDGRLTARTGSGSIEADGKVLSASHLQSGSGSIRIHPGPDAHYNVEASTGSGSIRIAGSNDQNHHHVSRSVNGGGPLIEAHTGSGSIEID